METSDAAYRLILHKLAVNFIPPELEKILLETAELSRAYLVGGAVRDALLGRSHGRDFDIEVFGVNYEQLVQALSRWGPWVITVKATPPKEELIERGSLEYS